MLAVSAKDLDVYQEAYALAMDLFERSAVWPAEEKYALTSQIRRSTRSVCANLSEGWAKRRYAPHFLLKLTDADAENNETATWLDFARDCNYLKEAEHKTYLSRTAKIGRMLGAMIKNHKTFLVKNEYSPPAVRR